MEPMRRFRQELSKEEVEAVLNRNEYGVLAIERADEAPYCLPLNYVYEKGKLYIHGATKGYKNQLLEETRRVAFTVVDNCTPDPDRFSAKYKSVVATGMANLMEDEIKKQEVLAVFCRKYFPGLEDKFTEEIKKRFQVTSVYEIEIQTLRGKASMDQVQ